MSAIDSKYNLKIGEIGLILSRQARANRYIYTRDEAPTFVNKFGSGDPNYRDATFFPHWANIDWRNGFDQEFYDDPSRFYRSDAVDITESTKLKLEEAFDSAGQIGSGVSINCLVALPGTDTGWADTNYGYRQKITVTAPSGQALPSGYPVMTDIDTDALETAGKVLANRNDWRIYYYNGASWVDLRRDYVGTSETWFPLQASISAGASDDNYYAYYDYSSESTTKEPSSDAEYNEVYGFPEDDANTKLLLHVIDTSGTNVQDTSGGGHDVTLTDGASITGTGKFANAMSFDGTNDYGSITDHSDLKPTGNFTIECYVKTTDTSATIFSSRHITTGGGGITLGMDAGKLKCSVWDGAAGTDITGSGTINDDSWHHVAFTWDGSNLKTYIDGSLDQTQASTRTPNYHATNYVRVACNNDGSGNNAFFAGSVAGLRLVNGTAKTSFPHASVTSSPTVSNGSELAQGSATSTGGATILAGCDDGKIYSWDGSSTWTEEHDTTEEQVLCATLAEFSGTTYVYFGTGDPTSIADGTGKIVRTSDVSTFNEYTLTGGTASGVWSLAFYGDALYCGTGPVAEIYKTTDGTTFSIDKDINEPTKPGYVYDMELYNGQLFAAGGHPEKFKSSISSGFLYTYDGFEWRELYPFNFTVLTSLAVFDSVLFIGTIKKDLYVYNTASVDKLLEFPWDVSISDMAVYKDKLAIALEPTDEDTATGNEAIYLFDRNGLHDAFSNTATGYRCLLNINNMLLSGTTADGYVYKTVQDKYASSGTLQTSYYEAQLPSIDKLNREVSLLFDAMPTGCSIKVEYKYDEGESWTTLGTSNTPGATEETFTFAVDSYGKKLTLRFTLETTDTSKTPTLRKAIVKYVLMPDLKYMWKMTVVCPDNIIWLDGTEPISTLGASASANDTTLTLNDASGFPNPNGDTMYATIYKSDGTEDTISYTGISGSDLTGIPSSGTYAIGDSYTTSDSIRIKGSDLHRAIKLLKDTKKLYTLTDIDGNTYTVLFHSYDTSSWVIDQVTYTTGVEENDVVISLLEA